MARQGGLVLWHSPTVKCREWDTERMTYNITWDALFDKKTGVQGEEFPSPVGTSRRRDVCGIKLLFFSCLWANLTKDTINTYTSP